MAAAFTANQQATQASAQAAEIRQQLAVLHAEMLSMQHALPATTSTIPASAATPTVTIPPPVISPTTMPSQVMWRPIDPKSPLSEGIQQLPWPTAYKPITLPKFNRKTDPHQFIMSYEAAVASAGGDDAVLVKSFVIAAEGDALAWYSMLKPSTVYSQENLWDKILANFKGLAAQSLTSTDLFQCRQMQGETLHDYFWKFVQLKAKAPDVPEEIAIEAAIKGLRIGPFIAHLARKKPTSI